MIEQLQLTPIGIIHTDMTLKFDAPSQPENSTRQRHVIELFPGHGFEQALKDLSGFDRIWVLWWFHRNKTWRPMVLPPRGNGTRRGVFATRSPHRPCPIGLTAVPLISISGRKITVGNTDLLDGTPILDIKPYVGTIDAFPEARPGWIEEVERELARTPLYSVELSALAASQSVWLEDKWGIQVIEKARAILERTPEPNRTRRISRSGERMFRMGCGAWRLFFSIGEGVVVIHKLTPGYPMRLLKSRGHSDVPHRDAQLAFVEKWPDS